MKFDKKGIPNKTLKDLLYTILKPRMIEERMLILLRQGKISKWFSGIGQEAISCGLVMAMHDDEYILPMHRNLGIFTGRGLPLEKLFAQFQGKLSGFTKGRDRSFHFGTNQYHIVGMISHLGPQMGVGDGIALASKLAKENKVTAVFTGDGGSSEGDFHEAINVAAVWDLPIIFVIENNGYGLSTPSSEQFRFKSFTQKGPAYGIDAYSVDGNNILDVYKVTRKITESMRKKPRPVILEAITFRMRGHEEASGTKYVPKKLMDFWAKKDPVDNYEKFLLREKVITKKELEKVRNEISQEIEAGLKTAFAESLPKPESEAELLDIFSPFDKKIQPAGKKSSSKRLVDAISDGLSAGLKKFPNLIFMGQDVAEYGGVFKVSEGFINKFGKDRVRNTPLCESAILGIGLGLSVKGYKSVIEMQFADFVSSGFNQVVNNLAKSHYRWGQNADVVIRMPTGAGVSAGPFHSQSNEAWFFHTPGIKIVYPSNPYDAKGLLIRSIEDPNPVMFFEHKALYRSVSGEVPDGYYSLEIGKGKRIREGNKLSIITYGMGVHWASEIAEAQGYSIDIIDLRSLMPWDKDLVEETVKKTGKVLILHEDSLTGGIGAEISAWISEHCFTSLDAPVSRLGSLDTPVPFSAPLEQNFLPQGRLKQKIEDLLEF